MSAKYLFFDYDGTLAEAEKHPSDTVIAALNRAQANGHKIFICSGRCRYMLPEIHGVRFDGYVLACGTDVRVGDTVLTDHLISHTDFKECAGLALSQNKTLIAEGENVAVRIGTGGASWGCPQAESYDDFITRFGQTALINKFSVINPCGGDLISAAERAGFRYINHFTSGEFVPNGFSKESGIRKVLTYFGAKRSDSVSFGDSMNDCDMIRYAGTGVVMENAAPDLKIYADFVTESVQNDGVAYYINEILLKG